MPLSLTGMQCKYAALAIAAGVALFIPFEMMETPVKLAVLFSIAAAALVLSWAAHFAPNATRIKIAIWFLLASLALQLYAQGHIREYRTPARTLHTQTTLPN